MDSLRMGHLFCCCLRRKGSNKSPNGEVSSSSTPHPKTYLLKFRTNSIIHTVQVDPRLVEELRIAYIIFPTYLDNFSPNCIDDITDDEIVMSINLEPVSEYVQFTLRQSFVLEYALLRCGVHAVEGKLILSTGPDPMPGLMISCIMLYIQRTHQYDPDSKWYEMLLNFEHSVHNYISTFCS